MKKNSKEKKCSVRVSFRELKDKVVIVEKFMS